MLLQPKHYHTLQFHHMLFPHIPTLLRQAALQPKSPPLLRHLKHPLFGTAPQAAILTVRLNKPVLGHFLTNTRLASTHVSTNEVSSTATSAGSTSLTTYYTEVLSSSTSELSSTKTSTRDIFTSTVTQSKIEFLPISSITEG